MCVLKSLKVKPEPKKWDRNQRIACSVQASFSTLLIPCLNFIQVIYEEETLEFGDFYCSENHYNHKNDPSLAASFSLLQLVLVNYRNLPKIWGENVDL